MEPAQWRAVVSGVAPRLVALAALVAVTAFIASCGSRQPVSTNASALSPPALNAPALNDDAGIEPLSTLELADELRDAAVQALALELPDPIVEMATGSEGEVLLAVANTWETVDLTIRSIEETPTEVVVFASPVRADWALGDGHELRCDEFGNIDDDGECVHTYPQHGHFEGAIELIWGLSWALDGEHQGVFSTASTGASFVVDR